MDIKTRVLDLLTVKKALKLAPSPTDFFRLKSGRASPYFVSTGALSDGESQSVLKKAFAETIKKGLDNGTLEEFDYVFGPAYKGIPLAVLACEGLFEEYGLNKKVLYDRKEAKDYGDATGAASAGQWLVGADGWTEGQRVLLIDDVITTGKAKYESLERLKLLPGLKLAGMVLVVDRQERLGTAEEVGAKSAVEEINEKLGIKTSSILTASEIYSLRKDSFSPEVGSAWRTYFEKYGAVKLG
ncbi:orotate phosphoribosyltransferase [Candidatus Micrarchaeota archaeon CG1_02_55_22]|nr:MAG: orotate phosphoribosyltransferase [Candidatus Micrarchaeota archaeon CG1_02_55_22]